MEAIVSIHAPAWGATLRKRNRVSLHQFQSTRPHGARRNAGLAMHEVYTVSIHAPAWGATSKLQKEIFALFCFNPRARMGRDLA